MQDIYNSTTSVAHSTPYVSPSSQRSEHPDRSTWFQRDPQLRHATSAIGAAFALFKAMLADQHERRLDMPNKHTFFLIESEPTRHKLYLNGQMIATFATLDAAEAEANKIAGRAVPGASLRFGLDFKWTLSDLEMRAAQLD
jgi:hypothetical protein